MLKFTSKSDVNNECKCTVRLLDDAEVIECDIQPRYKAQYLLDYVCEQLDVVEKDYFGLRYVDHRKQRKWLDFTKSIVNQVRDVHSLILCFRVKFYPPDPMRLSESTRYQLFLQLKRDLQHGRLYSPGPGHDMAFLAALCLQEELGDYDPERHLHGYVSEMNLILSPSEKVEQQIVDFHSGKVGAIPGTSPMQAVNAFLKKAVTLDTYGIDPHPVKEPRGARMYIGTNHSGVATFQNGRRTHHFRWAEISKLNYEGKMFIVHLIIMEDARTKKKHTVGFKCATSSDCRHLWRYSVEQRIFFTFRSSADIPAVVTGGSFFSRGSKVRYCGRVERELSEDFNSLPNSRSARSREAFATRRAASEPCRDSDERDPDDDPDEMALFDHRTKDKADRRKDDLAVPRIRAHGPMSSLEDGSSASASTKTSSQFPEGRDSYDASSCGSGSQDDHSDVASWVALDLRQLSRRDRNSMNGDTSTLENGYDDVAVDSDFYGYAAETGAAGSSIWSTTAHVAHQADGDSQHSFDMRLRDKSRFYNHDRATPPTHLQPISSKQRYGSGRTEAAYGWVEPRRPRGPTSSSSATGSAAPASTDDVQTTTSLTTAPSMDGSYWLWTKFVLLMCTSLFTMFTLLALILVLIYETDFHWAIHLRHWPELAFIQRHLYIPLRSLFPY